MPARPIWYRNDLRVWRVPYDGTGLQRHAKGTSVAVLDNYRRMALEGLWT